MKLYTYISGEGEPVVFLPTGLQTSESDFNSQKEYFSERFKMIIPDLRGHGRSVTNDLEDILEKTSVDIKETMDELGIEAFHLVGCSSGALCAYLFALKYPARVKSLTLSGVFFEKPGNWEEMNKNQKASIEQLLKSEEAVSSFNELHPHTDWRKILDYSMEENFYPFDAFSKLSQLTMPVHVIAGEEAEEELAGIPIFKEKVKQGLVTIISESGHLAYEEQPETFNKQVSQFIESVLNDAESSKISYNKY